MCIEVTRELTEMHHLTSAYALSQSQLHNRMNNWHLPLSLLAYSVFMISYINTDCIQGCIWALISPCKDTY